MQESSSGFSTVRGDPNLERGHNVSSSEHPSRVRTSAPSLGGWRAPGGAASVGRGPQRGGGRSSGVSSEDSLTQRSGEGISWHGPSPGHTGVEVTGGRPEEKGSKDSPACPFTVKPDFQHARPRLSGRQVDGDLTFTMSSPPTSSPFTYSCGYVGQLENVFNPCRTYGNNSNAETCRLLE